MKARILTALTSICFALTPISGQAAEHLSGPEIQKQLIGVKLSSKTRKGKPFSVTFDASGGGKMDIKKVGKFDATWHIDGEKMCWKIKGEPDECSFVVPGKSKFTFVDATTGKTNNVYSVK